MGLKKNVSRVVHHGKKVSLRYKNCYFGVNVRAKVDLNLKKWDKSWLFLLKLPFVLKIL